MSLCGCQEREGERVEVGECCVSKVMTVLGVNTVRLESYIFDIIMVRIELRSASRMEDIRRVLVVWTIQGEC